jgi:hypothetical protein
MAVFAFYNERYLGLEMEEGMRRLKVEKVLFVTVLAVSVQLGTAQDRSASRTSMSGKLGSHEILSQRQSRPSEGITVHGQWTITVRNPDGTVAATHKFENSLLATGATLLVQVLARQKAVQYWQVRLINKDGCVCNRAGNRVDCGIIDSSLTPDVSTDFATLSVSAPSTGPNAGKLVLSGTAPAAFDGQIKAVTTSVGNTCAPNSCSSTTWSPFTAAFPAPISVQAGQTMDVTVVLSFS